MTRETERESSGSLWGLGIFNSAKKSEWLQPTGEGQEVSETEEESGTANRSQATANAAEPTWSAVKDLESSPSGIKV